jgi:hypothetical protein
MFQFTYKLKITEPIKAKCERHPRYNPERDGRGGIRGGCSACFSLFDLHQARLSLEPTESFEEELSHGRECATPAVSCSYSRRVKHPSRNEGANRGPQIASPSSGYAPTPRKVAGTLLPLHPSRQEQHLMEDLDG